MDAYKNGLKEIEVLYAVKKYISYRYIPNNVINVYITILNKLIIYKLCT